MPNYVEPSGLVGQEFGTWKVLDIVARVPGKKDKLLCQCSCGLEKDVWKHHLLSGHSLGCQSCRSSGPKTHGHTGTKWMSLEYRVWDRMLDRCRNPNNISYHNYGGRGITVCKRWLKFENFLADMGERPSKDHSIDRINNNRGYTPKNCRWATRKQQALNRRRKAA